MAHGPTSNNPFDQQKSIPGVKTILAVSSGKGGVGKSTVSTNLALALGKKLKVGLLDADVYGPSIPRMMGSLNQKPGINEQQRLQPIERYGIKMMSMGFVIDEGAAVVWRGPMLFKAMDQFLRDVDWGDLDVLVVDLPPGTGDIQLTLAQKTKLTAAICVTTPQNISLIDVKKALDMWKRLNIPILGVVENMSYMLNPANGERMQLFPKGELDAFLDQQQLTKMIEIPFHPQVGMACEAGIPVVQMKPESAESAAFMKLADQVAAKLGFE